MSDQISLRINGTDYSGWTKVAITRSIDSVCGSFDLTLTERWEGASDRPPQVRAGDECEVYCDDDLVLTGFVDDALPAYNATQHSISVRGRSKARDLVDCGRPARQWQNQTLLQLARALADPFGITVRADTDVGAAFERPAIEPGQTAFEFLEKLARQRGVRFISDPDGTLVITGVGSTRVADTLELGRNIRSASGSFSMRDRFHTTTVLGQRAGTSWAHSEASAQMSGSAVDDDVDKRRVHYLVAENAADTADCRRRASWKRNTAYGRGRALTYTVYGWRNTQGLWLPNTRVPVYDRWMGFDGDEFLIASLRYRLDDEGRRTELQLMPPEAFELLPLPPKKAPAKWS
nr:tail protein [Gammaproteobacteria bacterium]